MNEFELIARYFARPPLDPALVLQAGGDDCAVLQLGDRRFAVTADMLLEGRHFLAGADPAALGHKALAVNLSDLAAAGAEPRCFLLALALPRADPAWLEPFADGLYALADEHRCALVGGDTTRVPRINAADGPLTICITALGEVGAAGAHSRAGARPGDDLWVSGELGDAALALAHLQGHLQLAAADLAAARQRLERPAPRVKLGIALRGVASSCIDVSDGLVGDAGHIAERSGSAVEIELQAVPLGQALQRQRPSWQRRCALGGGDDYELLFTAPPQRRAAVQAAAQAAGVPVSRVGRVAAGAGVTVLDAAGNVMDTTGAGYDHFA